MSVISGAISAITGKKAGNQAAAAANNAAAIQADLGNRALDMQQPFLDRGDRAGRALEYELGLAERPVFRASDYEEQEPQNALSVVTIPGGPQYTPNPLYSTADSADVVPQNILSGFDVEKFAVGDQEFLTRDAADNHLAQLLREQEAERLAADQGFEYQGFQATPGYDFRVAEGQKAIERAAAAGGRLNSGATAKALTRFGQDYASNEYNNYLNRLSGLAGGGQVAANSSANILQGSASGQANALIAGGNAKAAGTSAFGNSLAGGISDLGGAIGFGLGGGFSPTSTLGGIFG